MSDYRRIVGPPGCGKSTTIRRRVERWVNDEGIPPESIVLTSFTRSAAVTLRGSVDTIPQQNVTTLHSLGYRSIGRPPLIEGNKDLVTQWNAERIPDDWRLPLKGRWDADDPLTSDPLKEGDGSTLALYSLYRNTLQRSLPLWESVKDFAKRWEDFKRQTGGIDFTDMIELALHNSNACPGDPQCFVVDEAQDLNPLQWQLAHQWGIKAENYIVAGDPAQVLYSWIGARPDELLVPLPADRHYLLQQSYRLPEAVQQYAEQWLHQHSGNMCDGRTYHARKGAEGSVYHDDSDITWKEPECIRGWLEDDMANGRTSMVLASCGYLLEPTIKMLREYGIPFHNPYKATNGAWNPLHRSKDTGVSSAQRLRLYLEGATSGPRVSTWVEALPAKGNFCSTKKGALERLAASGLVSSLDGILSPAACAAWEHHDVAWFASHVEERMRRPVEFASQIMRRDPALLDTEPSIIVGTMHSVKGGEADNVYLFPDLPLRVVDESYQDGSQRDALVRQWYVGLTRSAHDVTVLSAENDRGCFDAI